MCQRVKNIRVYFDVEYYSCLVTSFTGNISDRLYCSVKNNVKPSYLFLFFTFNIHYQYIVTFGAIFKYTLASINFIIIFDVGLDMNMFRLKNKASIIIDHCIGL